MYGTEKNTVTVRIYGQEYTISGEMSREAIMKIADYVDGKMTEIGEGTTMPVSKVAILSAATITEELFQEQSHYSDYEKNLQLWEQTKLSHQQLKNDLTAVIEKNNDLIRQNGEKDSQLSNLYSEMVEIKKQNEALRARNAELNQAVEQMAGAPEEAKKKISDLETKCRDIESSFFDIQMENIRLKNENDILRKTAQALQHQ